MNYHTPSRLHRTPQSHHSKIQHRQSLADLVSSRRGILPEKETVRFAMHSEGVVVTQNNGPGHISIMHTIYTTIYFTSLLIKIAPITRFLNFLSHKISGEGDQLLQYHLVAKSAEPKQED